MTINPTSTGGVCPRCGNPWTPGAVACPRCGFVVAATIAQPVVMAPVQPPSSLWPTVLITLFFNLFGLIPAALGSDRDRSNGYGGARQWMAFLITWLLETLAGLVLALLMPALVLGWLGIHHDDDKAGSTPSVAPSISVPSPVAASSSAPAPAATATTTTTVAAPATAPTARVTTTVTITQVSVVNSCGASGTGDCYLSVRSAPSGTGHELTRINEGQTLQVLCQVHGGFVHSSIAGDSDVWSKVQGGGYVSNLFIQGDGISPTSTTTVCS